MSVLSKYQRHPKHYVTLPSNGFYYEDGSLELTTNGELPVRAMSAKDELLLKNPEALLNGDSVARVIKSCSPEIKMDIMNVVAPDIEVILLAILSASYDDKLDFEAVCPECETSNEFQVVISNLINNVNYLDPPFVVSCNIDLGEDEETEIKFYLSPYTYKQETQYSLMQIENSKMFNFLSNEDLDEDEKLAKYADSFKKMIELNFSVVADSIVKIETPEGVCEDRTEINEFISEQTKEVTDKLTEKIDEINLSGIDRNFSAKCQNKECGHEWTTNVEFDPARFFAHTSIQ